MRNKQRSLTYVFLSGLVLSIVGCGLTSEEILKSSTQALCETVTAPTSVDFRNKEILAELQKRNSAGCATQEILDSKLADYKRAQGTETEGDQGNGGGGY